MEIRLPLYLIAIALFATFASAQPAGETLRRYDLAWEYISRNSNDPEHSYVAKVEKGLSQSTIRTIEGFVDNDDGDFEYVGLQISKVPAKDGQYLVIAAALDGQSRFYILNSQFKEIARIYSGECQRMDTVFFVGEKRTLIVASNSAFDGAFCGNYIFEFIENKLNALGQIYLYDGQHGPEAYQGHNPMARATAKYKDRYYMTMIGKGNLYESGGRLIARRKVPVTYFFDGVSWSPLKNTRKSGPSKRNARKGPRR